MKKESAKLQWYNTLAHGQQARVQGDHIIRLDESAPRHTCRHAEEQPVRSGQAKMLAKHGLQDRRCRLGSLQANRRQERERGREGKGEREERGEGEGQGEVENKANYN